MGWPELMRTIGTFTVDMSGTFPTYPRHPSVGGSSKTNAHAHIDTWTCNVCMCVYVDSPYTSLSLLCLVCICSAAGTEGTLCNVYAKATGKRNRHIFVCVCIRASVTKATHKQEQTTVIHVYMYIYECHRMFHCHFGKR